METIGKGNAYPLACPTGTPFIYKVTLFFGTRAATRAMCVHVMRGTDDGPLNSKDLTPALAAAALPIDRP